MREYIVYRHGSDPADVPPGRGSPAKRAVARVEAGNPEEACRVAARQVTLAPGQHLSAEPAAPVDAHEADLNRTSRALARDTRGGEGPTEG